MNGSSGRQNPLIVMKNVTRVYGSGQASMQALRGISLDIFTGDFVAVMGASGSGKSTCLNILGCLDIPTSGSYLFQGIAVESLSRNQRSLLRRYYLGFVFQGYNLLSRTSALENVELPLVYRKIPAGKRRQAALEALEAVELQDWQSHTPAELSGGQQQRVAVARALANSPAIILADEPTGNLDLKTGEEIISLLKEMSDEQGVTVISATHDYKMLNLSDQVIWIRDGRVDKIQERDELEINTGGMSS